jgi:3-oxoacyl-[acyl-carrier-protein] synthase II
VLGNACTNDAYSMAAPHPGGTPAANAIRGGLTAAGGGTDIDSIHGHACATPLGDSAETKAIRAVFGPTADRIPVSGTQPLYGHPLGASGGIETIVSTLAMKNTCLPPSLNFEDPSDDRRLDHLVGSRRTPPGRTVLSNSFGFRGIDASPLFRRIGDAPDTQTAPLEA